MRQTMHSAAIPNWQIPPIPPPGHAAIYGPPPGFSVGGTLLLFAFPLIGAAAAWLVRAITR